MVFTTEVCAYRDSVKRVAMFSYLRPMNMQICNQFERTNRKSVQGQLVIHEFFIIPDQHQHNGFN